jgi:PPM family protein phosphatase
VEEPPRPEPRVAFAGVTDVGRQRKHNEDCLLIKAEHGLFCVADGMGGHNAGDVASKLVATSLGNYFEATAAAAGGDAAEGEAEYAALAPGARRLAAGVSKANRDVFTISSTVQQHHGMGSTVVAIHLSEGMVHVAHVGDSRCYRIRDGEMTQLTRDHSLINDALEMKPDLTKEELARLPKNIITRALGMKDVVKVDVKSEPVLPGDAFLLCSDGLTGMVPVDQILDVIALASEPQEACELLIAEANDHGGTDNISAILVHLSDPRAALPSELDISDHAELVGDDADDDGGAEEDALQAAAFEAEVEAAADAADAALIAGAEGVTEVEISPESERITMPAAPAALRTPPPPPPVLAEPAGKLPAPPRVAQVVAQAPILEIVADPATEDALPLWARPTLEVARQTPPDLEIGVAAGPQLEDLISPEEADALASGAEIDLDVRGPWPNKPVVLRCTRCRYELFPGNAFCVECGARIEASSGAPAEP